MNEILNFSAIAKNRTSSDSVMSAKTAFLLFQIHSALYRHANQTIASSKKLFGGEQKQLLSIEHEGEGKFRPSIDTTIEDALKR
jgi:hypothetical protein